MRVQTLRLTIMGMGCWALGVGCWALSIKSTPPAKVQKQGTEGEKGRKGEGEKKQNPTAPIENPKSKIQNSSSLIPHPSSLFWSFRPVMRPAVPKVAGVAWAQNPIDAFVLQKLEAKKLQPAPAADKRTLIRRVTFDLTGVPPTPEEVENFVADKSPDAWAKVVDRLLASPAYGEKWGRHWLDLVRYTDSLDARGIFSEGDIAEAWRYRDWVVNALNKDMPYNQFVQQQIAGDILPEAGKEDITTDGIVATGLLAIGNWGNGDADKEKILTDIADDQIDVVSRSVMGITVACARCHDHKFDPISTKDYYSLAGIFFSTHILPKLTPKGAGETPLRVALLTPKDKQQREQYMVELRQKEEQLAAVKAEVGKNLTAKLLPQIGDYAAAAWDYSHRDVAQAQVSLEAFAKSRGLQPFALGQWRSLTGMQTGKRMDQFVAKVLDTPGVMAWHGKSPNPTLTLNSNAEARSLLTFTLPPQSVCVHPGPASGVSVAWRSPISGKITVKGKVVDADKAGGDGIAWKLEQSGEAGSQPLGAGAIDNGGMQEFAGKDGKEIAVGVEDRLVLTILPKAEYTCDTTNVEMEIKDVATGQTWNLSRDWLRSAAMNPVPDAYGHPAVWTCEERDDKANLITPNLSPRWRERLTPILADAGLTDVAKRTRVQTAAISFADDLKKFPDESPFVPREDADLAVLPEPERSKAIAALKALNDCRKQMPPPIEYANGAQEGGVPESPQAGFHDVRIHKRGNYATLGEVAPRGFPAVILGNNPPKITTGSGRRELAEWITRPTHPLTARVIVNRLWQHHFGQGIVRTPSNFGLLGERPTHPELLDWLASELVRQKWSLKAMHRLILLSNAYKQSSVPRQAVRTSDPDNRLFGRQSRTRLDAEGLRDAMLAVGGKLETMRGGKSIQDTNVPRRTLYLTTIRSDRTGFRALFDGADPTTCVDRRTVSTVAPQALYLLNNDFVTAQADALAVRLLKISAGGERDRIQSAYRLLYGRPATAAEMGIGERYLSRMRAVLKTDAEIWSSYAQILLCSNEFAVVD